MRIEPGQSFYEIVEMSSFDRFLISFISGILLNCWLEMMNLYGTVSQRQCLILSKYVEISHSWNKLDPVYFTFNKLPLTCRLLVLAKRIRSQCVRTLWAAYVRTLLQPVLATISLVGVAAHV